MKQISIYLSGLILICGCNSNTAGETKSNLSELKTNDPLKESNNDGYKGFKLYYSYAGLGSGMGKMEPTFRATGTDYVYTFEQNSYYSKPDKKPELRCKGILRTSSIDSVVNIVKAIKDTLIYKTNVHILSGGIGNLSVTYGKRTVSFQLHNAYDKTAQKILDIINSNIPDTEEKLWLFKFPDSK
jgi:hypothetical protein